MTPRLLSLTAAAALHAAAFLIPHPVRPPEAAMRPGQAPTVDLDLVAAPAAPAAPVALEPSAQPPEPPEPQPVAKSSPPPAPPQPAVAAPPARQTAAPSARQQTPAAMPGGASPATTQAAPDYLSNPPPAYPAPSRKAGEQGVVLLAVRVNPAGRPERVEIRRGSGFARLDSAALAAVRRWRFKPATRAGRPVPVQIEVPIRFQLN